jgi:Endopolygalacturonase
MKKMFMALTIAMAFGVMTLKAQSADIPMSVYDNLPFTMPKVAGPAFSSTTIRLEDFGGKGDGKTVNTSAFAKAIDALSARGGGVLEVLAGTWVTGPIVLKSNVNIHTEKGTKVLFTTDRNAYPLGVHTFEGEETFRCQSNISADNAENIAITGEGIFDGSGQVWRPVKKVKVTSAMWDELVASGGVLDEKKSMWYPSEGSLLGNQHNGNQPKTEKEWQRIKDALRPVMVNFTSCKNVLLSGITVSNSPSWTIHPLMCTNVILSNVKVENPSYGQNTDGIDIESCKNVVIYQTTVSVGDDGICIKSGKDEAGRKRGMPTENVIVKNCTVYHAHGGFVIGSEMSGGAKNIKVSDCVFKGTDTGLRFKSTRGRGGVVENIYVENISMANIVGDAAIFDLFYGVKGDKGMKEADVTTPSFRKIVMKNITCQGAKRAFFWNGLPEMKLKDISLENGLFITEQGAVIGDADGIKLSNVQIRASVTPELLINNAKNIQMDKIEFPGNDNPRVDISGESEAIFIRNSESINKNSISATPKIWSRIVLK